MAIHNIYDHALKILARTYPEYFLALALPNQQVELVGTHENVELALEIDRVDFLHEITINGDPAYLHIDFELKHSGPFPRRVYVYNGMLTELNKPIPVISMPIYLKPREKEVPKAHEVKAGGYVFHKFTYEPILLWEHVNEIRSGKFYPLAPLLVLLTKNPDQETLVEERDIIVKHEPDPIRRRTLFVSAVLTALGEKMFDPDFVWSFFKEKDMLLSEDPVLNRWFDERYGVKLAEAEAKAKREAEQEAKRAKREIAAAREMAREAEAKRRQEQTKRREAEAAQREAQLLSSVIKYLAQRFANISSELLLDLQRMPSKQYHKAMNLALDAPDLEAFHQKLKALLASTESI